MNASDNIKLTILTPESVLFEGMVCKVELPADKGRFMVLKNHAPVISFLSDGNVVYMSEGTLNKVHISAGFVRVSDNEVVVCAEL